MISEMKTPKGTILPFFMIERSKKNKQTGQYEKMPPTPYLQIAHRMVWLREEHPDWQIITEIVELSQDHCIFKATIKTEKGEAIANAHKREDRSDFADFMEKAETSAIGRALAMCGYGTQFAPEFDEGDRLADAPIQPAKQTPKVEQGLTGSYAAPQAQQQTQTEPKKFVPNAAKKASPAQIKRLFAIGYGRKFSTEDINKYIKDTYKLDSANDLNQVEYNDLVKLIETVGLGGKSADGDLEEPSWLKE